MARLIVQLGYTATAEEVASRLPVLNEDGGTALVAEIGGEVVGCLTTSIMQVLHRPAPVGRISMMVVDEAHRSKGIGEALVRAAEQVLAAQQCYMVEVTSRFARARAHEFYERLGYERNSVRLSRLVEPTS
jgi:predicted N-acetyltransferase YhbS